MSDLSAAATINVRGYRTQLEKLCRMSVAKRHDAYADVPWGDGEIAVDDRRWILHEYNELGATEWYRNRAQADQARIGLHAFAAFAKIGLQFENALMRGLLELALDLPNAAPEFRYAMHEICEEAQHSLMFQEFVNRSGLDVQGLSRSMLCLSRRVAGLAPWFPELFFFFVLGGEGPIDHQQRRGILGSAHERPPLLRRISQIHVTEEARHVAFAVAYLRRHVPELGRVRKLVLRIVVPLMLPVMTRLMTEVPRSLARRHGIPREVLRTAYRNNPAQRARTREGLRSVTSLCRELGLISAPFDRLWRWSGLL